MEIASLIRGYLHVVRRVPWCDMSQLSDKEREDSMLLDARAPVELPGVKINRSLGASKGSAETHVGDGGDGRSSVLVGDVRTRWQWS